MPTKRPQKMNSSQCAAFRENPTINPVNFTSHLLGEFIGFATSLLYVDTKLKLGLPGLG